MSADFYWGVLTGIGATMFVATLLLTIGLIWIDRDNDRHDPIGPRGKERLP